MQTYHDREWGTPQHGDRQQFELLILEGMQAGLSWSIVLNKRAQLRRSFAGFDAKRVARFDARTVRRLLADPRIIRNRAKIRAAITNARQLLRVRREFGTFDRYIWGFVGGRPVVTRYQTVRQIPSQTAASEAMSADLRRRGFRFVGPTICYAFMQAVGMVNDHTLRCFRRAQLLRQQ